MGAKVSPSVDRRNSEESLEPKRDTPTEHSSYTKSNEAEQAASASTAGVSGEKADTFAWDPDTSQSAWDPDTAGAGYGLQRYAASDAWNPDGAWNPDDEPSAWTSGKAPAHGQNMESGLEAAGTVADVPHGAQQEPDYSSVEAEDLGAGVPSTIQVPVQHAMESVSMDEPGELTPRDIIREQDAEYQESELMDAKKGVEARVKLLAAEVEKKEQEMEDAEDALRNATGRLERYGYNPKVEQERDAAEAKIAEITKSLDQSRKELDKFYSAASTLEAELVALRDDQQDECEF